MLQEVKDQGLLCHPNKTKDRFTLELDGRFTQVTKGLRKHVLGFFVVMCWSTHPSRTN